MRLSEMAHALSITRSATFRTAYTLTAMGCLLYDERSQTYTLGPGVLGLTFGFVASREVIDIARTELERLRTELGWSVHMGTLDGPSVLYVFRAAAGVGDTSIVHVGRRLPARSTAMGRVLLSGLDREQLVALYRPDAPGASYGKGPALPEILAQAENDRAAGLVIHTGDFEAKIVSAAAPIRDVSRDMVAAINVTRAKSPEALAEVEGVVRGKLLETADRISRLLGFDPEA
ncbi:hypothetical protein AVO45_18810 [Ruegeria marisrubri]|uniref:IclR-ED domain-containing protein n=2 Tax=Ruegeria marisrubri TaxID=1685379 RepID=A0A0X3UAW6_9RHOB|nr:hypothetical protein AVO45_18810 [Ruegeria marisrubri]